MQLVILPKKYDIIIKSKIDQDTCTLSNSQAICQQKQKELQSKCDQTMTYLTQAEGQCQQKQDDIQSSQGQLYITINSLQTQMTQVLEVNVGQVSICNTWVINRLSTFSVKVVKQV